VTNAPLKFNVGDKIEQIEGKIQSEIILMARFGMLVRTLRKKKYVIEYITDLELAHDWEVIKQKTF
jgi:hypothetical protein